MKINLSHMVKDAMDISFYDCYSDIDLCVDISLAKDDKITPEE